jgi:hypothetical protein
LLKNGEGVEVKEEERLMEEVEWTKVKHTHSGHTPTVDSFERQLR